MSYQPDEKIATYLKLLERELSDLPRARRREVVDEIAEHIAQARTESPLESEAELRTLLERIGDPSEIGAEARDRFGVSTRSNWHEIAAMILLLVGGFLLVVGWLAGAVLLWTSSIWTTRDKLIGTLILPGGLAFSFMALTLSLTMGMGSSCETRGQSGPSGEVITTSTCSGGPSTLGSIVAGVLLVAALIAPVLTTIYLARRLNSRKAELAGLLPSAGLGSASTG